MFRGCKLLVVISTSLMATLFVLVITDHVTEIKTLFEQYRTSYALPNDVHVTCDEGRLTDQSFQHATLAPDKICDVHIARKNSSLDLRAGLAYCTGESFREEVRKVGYYPGQGEWHLKQHGYLWDTFHPEHCRPHPQFGLPQTDPKLSLVQRCVKHRNWKYIVIAGDSHATRIADAFHRILLQHGANCTLYKTDKKNGFRVDPNYFRRKNIDNTQIAPGQRACLTCTNRAYNCGFSDGYKFVLEQLAISDVLDTNVQFKLGRYSQVHPSVTTQEFILRHYFLTAKPDLLFWEPPFAHSVNLGRNGWRKTVLNTAYLVSLVSHYIPPSSDVIWIPVTRVWIGDRDKFKTFEGESANAHLDKMNMGLFSVIKDKLLARHTNVSSIYDPIALSCPLENYTDHVHYDPFYYNSMVQLILQMKCL